MKDYKQYEDCKTCPWQTNKAKTIECFIDIPECIINPRARERFALLEEFAWRYENEYNDFLKQKETTDE
jgi:hypothetical protein